MLIPEDMHTSPYIMLLGTATSVTVQQGLQLPPYTQSESNCHCSVLLRLKRQMGSPEGFCQEK